MIRELDTVVLRRDLLESGLRIGDIGAVVYCYGDEATYEVEFVTADGRTVTVATLSEPDIRLMRKNEILHARELVAAD